MLIVCESKTEIWSHGLMTLTIREETMVLYDVFLCFYA